MLQEHGDGDLRRVGGRPLLAAFGLGRALPAVRAVADPAHDKGFRTVALRRLAEAEALHLQGGRILVGAAEAAPDVAGLGVEHDVAGGDRLEVALDADVRVQRRLPQGERGVHGVGTGAAPLGRHLGPVDLVHLGRDHDVARRDVVLEAARDPDQERDVRAQHLQQTVRAQRGDDVRHAHLGQVHGP
ncbi:hypothetical protein QBA54_35910 [Streptomyces sp. B21-108]